MDEKFTVSFFKDTDTHIVYSMVYIVYILYIVHRVYILYRAYILYRVYIIYTTFTILRAFIGHKGSVTGAKRRWWCL